MLNNNEPRNGCTRDQFKYTGDIVIDRLYFLPLKFIFRNNPKSSYVDIIGVSADRRRMSLRIKIIDIYVDILCDERSRVLQEQYDCEIIDALPGIGLSKPKKYMRLTFDKIKERQSFIDENHEKYTICNDDKYKYLFSRIYKYNTAGWNVIADAQQSFTHDVAKIPLQYEIKDGRSMTAIDISAIPNIDLRNLLFKDGSIICAWDLETYTKSNIGRVPQHKYSEDSIKMCSMVFRYHWDTVDLLNVVISAIPISVDALVRAGIVNPRVIITSDIPTAMSRVLATMQPDYITGFNDGSYDWPFVKARTRDPIAFKNSIKSLNLNSQYESHLAGPLTYGGQYGMNVKEIKIEASGRATYDGYVFDGAVAFDTMIEMRRINPTEKRYNLNTFLDLYGIKLKEEMPYTTMSIIFYLWTLTTPSAVQNIIDNDKDAADRILYPNDSKIGDIAISHLTAREILNLFALTDQVAIYCVRDSAACIDLLYKVNRISDVREFSNMNGCSTDDGFYLAGGIKVKNHIYTAATDPLWGAWDEKYPLMYSMYKKYVNTKNGKKVERPKIPGGYVIYPKKGLYGRSAIENILYKVCDADLYEKIMKDSSLLTDVEFIRKIAEYADRPSSGLDFNSLYPSIICAYNLSPEMYANNKVYEEMQQIFRFLYIKTHYKLNSVPKSSESRVTGYFVQHESVQVDGKWQHKNHGIIPTLLCRMAARRSAIKKDMILYDTIYEKLSKDIPKSETTPTLDVILETLREKIAAINIRASNLTGVKRDLELSKIWSYQYAIDSITKYWTDYDTLLSEAFFKKNYYNSKQLAVKLLMNTIYGEMGNPDSPFFVTTMSGGVTKMGRRALKEAKKFVESQNYHVYYGDTDSVYISPSHEHYIDADTRYYAALINAGLVKREPLNSEELGVFTFIKQTYYEEMVGITMTKMKEISGLIIKHFIKYSGGPFLSMAYEEVLFPFGYFGKKNYYGVKHVDSINFDLCHMPDVRKFIKDVFVRGMPLRRRETNDFIRHFLAKILMRFAHMTEIKPYDTILHELVISYINDTIKNPSKYNTILAKNYSFREPNENTRTAQMRFRERMTHNYIHSEINSIIAILQKEPNDVDALTALKKYYRYDDKQSCWVATMPEVQSIMRTVNIDKYEVDQDLLQLKFTIPSYGSRLDLIITARPRAIEMSGKFGKLSRGDTLEYIGFLENNHYANYLRRPYEKLGISVDGLRTIKIDFKYYFDELYSKLARLMLYKPEYNDMIEDKKIEHMHTSKSQKEAYKKAEQEVKKIAHRALIQQYANYFPQFVIDNKGIKKKFRETRKQYISNVGAGFMSKLFERFVTESNITSKTLVTEIEKSFITPRLRVYGFNSEAADIIARTKHDYIDQAIYNTKRKLMGYVIQICVDINGAQIIEAVELAGAAIRESNRLYVQLCKYCMIKEMISSARVTKSISNGSLRYINLNTEVVAKTVSQLLGISDDALDFV